MAVTKGEASSHHSIKIVGSTTDGMALQSSVAISQPLSKIFSPQNQSKDIRSAMTQKMK
jgi:hypothetical protein